MISPTGTLPEDLWISATSATGAIGCSVNANVEVGQSGKLVLALQLPQNLTAPSIPVTLGGHEFGTATAALATVTLQAPAEVALFDPFKVYGEVVEGSAVSIKNAETGEVYATAIPSGRFYAADLLRLNDKIA